MERTYEAPSNEAPHMILGYHQGRLVTYLLQFLNGDRLSQEPASRFQYFGLFYTVVVIWMHAYLDFNFGQN